METYPGTTTLILSNENLLAPPGGDNNVLYWREISPNDRKGYVCERPGEIENGIFVTLACSVRNTLR